MRIIVLERCAWAVAVIALTSAVRSWYRISRPTDAPMPAIWPVSPPARPIAADSLGLLTSRIIDSDPFRLDRRPAAVAYGATPDTLTDRASAPPAAPRPPLVLVGIVGPPWRALVDGVPGHDGSMVLRAGQSVAGLRVRDVKAATTTISTTDTTWHLAVKRTWP
ncbi:MAG TPA: hypothetical protein VN613_11505 [Gemmatimonadaceae bacterium]|jgi:hypothetical protein|nr:hypothetical protein [Gemmatimonadaceae bacterium]